jgi:aminoglycoside phosphotransferase (APT) family kinase protein
MISSVQQLLTTNHLSWRLAEDKGATSMAQSFGGLNLAGQYPCLTDIPGSSSWLQLAEMDAPAKTEHMYAILDQSDRRYLLKIAAPTCYDRIKREFEYLKLIRSSGVPAPDAIGFGLCSDGKALYLQTGWVNAKPISSRLGNIAGERQYALGTDAGLYLKRIHQVSLESRPDVTQGQFHTRYQKAMAAYRLCRPQISGERKLKHLISSALPDLDLRPAVLLHGCFQPAGILITPEDQIVMAHFDVWQYGDPLLDLANTLTWIRAVSLPFAIGILDCYFGFQITDEMLHLLSAYAALDLIERFGAAHAQGEAETKTIQAQADLFCKDYVGEKTRRPSWYKIMYKARLA